MENSQPASLESSKSNKRTLIEAKNWDRLSSFINTKKAFNKLYMFYFETFRIIPNPSSVNKIKQHLAMLAIQNRYTL